ncbi:MAG: hypothetical protein Q8N34_11335, partial [Gammaproteobacteria bacterium]|nr:hypothetical protein [Gammaproteobacteria bacterium]
MSDATLEDRAKVTVLLPAGVVSLVNRLPEGLVPTVPLFVPPASTAIAVSDTALGSLALDPETVI